MDDLHLPPIGSNYRIPPQIEVSDYQAGPRYENKLFRLPKVDNTKQSFINVPKTYTTRKGALLLYAEDFFLPGSPKPRKKRHRIKKQSSLKLKTISDLRNSILDYKNGVCMVLSCVGFKYFKMIARFRVHLLDLILEKEYTDVLIQFISWDF